MPKYAKRDYQVGEFWLSKQSRSPAWCRTWFDVKTRQTRRASLSKTDFDEAKQRLTEWFIVNQTTKNEDPSRVSLAEIFAPYYEKHGSKLSNPDNARIGLRYWLEFYEDSTIAKALEIPQQEAFHQWLKSEKKIKNNTIIRVIGVGKAALNWAFKRGYITNTPYVLSVKSQAAKPMVRPLETSELSALFRASTHQHVTDFLWLLSATAARPQALLELTTKQVNLDKGLIQLNRDDREQTKKYRPALRIPETIKPLLERRIRESKTGYIIEFKGKPLKSVKTAWNKIRDNAGLDSEVNPYSIRHTIARWLRAQGVPRMGSCRSIRA